MAPINEYDDMLAEGAPVVKANEYDTMVADDLSVKKSALKQSMFVAEKVEPDRQAKVLEISKKMNLPSSIVERNYDTLSQAQPGTSTDYDELIEKSPKTAGWLEDTNNAGVARDDIGNLRETERAVQDHSMLSMMYSSLNSGLASMYGSVARVPALAYDVAAVPQNLVAKAAGRSDLMVKSPDWAINNPVAKYYDRAAEAFKTPEMDRSITNEISQGNYKRAGMTLAAQFAANAPQQAAIIAGTLLGFGVPALVGAGVTTASSSNQDNREAGVDPLTGTLNAVSKGAIESSFESLGTFGLLKSWENAIAKEYGKQVSTEVFKDFAKTLLYTGAGEANEEALTSVAQDLTDYITGVNPDALEGIGQRALDSFIIGGASGGAMTAPSAIGAGLSRGAKIRNSTLTRDFYLSLGNTAAASKLRERLPEAQRQYVENITKDSPVENLYISTEAIDTYFQSKKINPTKAMQDIGTLDAYTESKETGTDIKIPLSTWVEKVVGTEYYQGLADDVKFDPTSLSVNEAKAEGAEVKGALDAEAKAATAEEGAVEDSGTQARVVRDNVVEQLKASGQDAKSAETYAQIYESAFKSLGERTGVSPLDLFNQFGLKIGNGDTETDGQTLNQSAVSQGIEAKNSEIRQTTAPLPQNVPISSFESGAMVKSKVQHPTSLKAALAKGAFGAGTFTNTHTGQEIRLTKNTADKIVDRAGALFDRAQYRNKKKAPALFENFVRVASGLPQIARNAVYVFDRPSIRPGEPPTQVFFAPVQMNGQDYMVSLDVKQGEVDKVEIIGEGKPSGGPVSSNPIAGQQVGPVSPEGNISVSDFEQRVNELRSRFRYFQDGSSGQAPAFYSKLQQTVEQKMGGSASPEQIKGMLRDIKPEEMKWSGIDEFLKGKEKVSKQDLLDFLRANALEIQEVTKAEFSGSDDIQSKIDAIDAVPDRERDAAWEAERSSLFEELKQNKSGTTKFAQYTLPGGENYREVLFTLPAQEPTDVAEAKSRIQEIDDRLKEIRKEYPTIKDRPLKVRKEIEALEIEQGKAWEKANKFDKSETYQSSHFDEANVLAHTRLNDRIDSDGKKVLFVEEIQSDWHQAGRKKGYKEDVAPVTEDNLPDGYWLQHDPEGPDHSTWKVRDKQGRIAGFATTKEEALADFNRVTLKAGQGSVPDAPFRKTWHEFVLKRLIREAAEKGYDSVAWTTGEQQADRYDLSHQVDAVFVAKNEDGTYNVRAVKDSNPVSHETSVSADKLPDVLGKDLSEKILSSNYTKGKAKKFSGVDLKVGGEGMKGFYDKILVDYANKFGKKYGAKVESSSLSEKAGSEYSVEENEDGLWNIIDEDGEIISDDFSSKEEAESGLKEFSSQSDRVTNKVHSLELTPQLKEAALNEGFSLFQRDDSNAPRGQITINGRNFRIDLLEGADKSTFLHETGHFYLEILGDLAKRENAPQQIKDDYDTIVQTLGGQTDGKFSVEQHEQFARSFEAYLMEGKAPSEGLRKAFSRFKVWLVSIYKRLTSLNVELSPEVRGVFDRLLATDEEIARAKAQQNADPLFADVAKSGMTGPRAEAYAKAIEESRIAAEDQVVKKVMSDYTRELKPWWDERKQKLRLEIADEIKDSTVYMAIDRLRSDELLPDGSKLKINKDAVLDTLGKDFFKTLPKKIVATEKEGGLNPDIVADALGFSSGETMLQQLAAAPAKEDFIEAEATRRMAELYPDLLTDGKLPEETMKAIHNEKRSQVLRLELEHLASNNMPVLKDAIRKVSRRVPTEKAVRDQARGIIARREVKNLSPHVFQRAEAKYAKTAGQLLAKGDIEGAFDAKRKELLNHELYRAAVEAQEHVEIEVDKWKKLSRADEAIAKSRDIDLVNAARAILAEYGVGKKDKPVSEYLDQIKRYDPETYETVSAIVDSVVSNAQPTSDYNQLSYDDFVNLSDAIESIWSLARTTKQIEVDGKMMDRDEAKAKLEERLSQITELKEKGKYDKAATTWDKTKMGLLGVRASLRRVESWASAMDGDSSNDFKDIIFNPISEAATRFREVKKGYLKKFLDVIKPIEKDLGPKKILSPELNYEFGSKAELLGAMLHTGNESNLSKLLRGRQWGEIDSTGALNTARWDAFVTRMWNEGVLTKKDYDVLQGLWDLFEETKPAAQKAHKQMYGRYFNEVTAQEVKTPFGNYRGGYAPATVDSFLSQDAAIRNEKESIEKSNNSFMFPTAGRGFTKSRVDAYAAPLVMDLKLVPMQLDKVLRFSEIEPHVKEVARLVMDRGFRRTLDAFDPTVGGDMLVPWLQRAAQQKISTPSNGWGGRALDTFFKEIRARTGLAVMTANVVNTLQNVTGLSIAATKVKPKYLRDSLWSYMKAPKKYSDDVKDKSEFMRNRMDASASEINQTIDELLLNPTKYEKARDFGKKHGYFLQTASQNLIDTVVWSGAYDQAVENGETEKEAVKEADSTVRQTQGSLSPEDVSRFETGTPFVRAFTQFYSYFNMQANLLGTEFIKVARDMGLKKGAGRALYLYTFGFMVPAVVGELIVRSMSGSLDSDDDDEYLDDLMSTFFLGQFRSATALFPVVGPTVQAGINSFNDKWYDDRISTSPAVSMIESAVKAPSSVYNAIVEDGSKKKAARDLLTALSLATGLPLSPLARPIGYLSDVSEGKADPSGPVDFTRGLITGKPGSSQ